MAKVYDAVLRLKDEFSKNIQNAEKHLDNFNRNYTKVGNEMIRTGRSIERTGSTLTKGLTLPLTAVGVFAGKAAIDFEDAFAGVRKTVDATEAEFQIMEKGLRNMAKEIPVSVEELSGIAESAGQLGIAKENIIDFTRVIADLGVATNLGDTAAEDLAKFANITGMSQEKFGNLGSTIIDLGNHFATTEADIVAMSMRIAGTGTQIGLTEAQIMAMSTAMSSVGINAEAGGGSMSRVMQKINTEVLGSGEKLENFAKVAGMSANEFSKVWKDNPQDAIASFVKGLDEIKKSGGDVAGTLKEMEINSTQEIDTLSRLSGAHEVLTDAMGMSAAAWEGNTALTKEAEEKYKTLASVLKTTWNNVKDLAISFGNELVPYIQKASDFVKNLSNKFDGLSESSKKTIVQVAMFLVALGPIISIFGKLYGSVGKLIRNFGRIGKAVTSAGGILKWIASGPAAIIIAVLVAIAAAVFLVIKNWDAIKAKAEQVFPGIGDTIKNIGNNIKLIFGEIAASASQFIDILVTTFSSLWDTIGPFIMGLVEGVRLYIDMMIGVFDGLIEFITGVFTGNWTQAWDGVVKIFTSIFEGITGIAKSVMNGVASVINKVIGGLNKIQIPSWVPGAGGKGINIPLIPTFAKGTNFFGGGLAQINEKGGEIVDLPQGSRIYPHDKSVQMARKDKTNGVTQNSYTISIPKLADQIIIKEEADVDKIFDTFYKRMKLIKLNTPQTT